MVIKTAIRNLYYRAVERLTPTEEYNRLLGKYSQLEQCFEKGLSEEQKKQFLILSDLNVDMNEERSWQLYAEGFALGNRIATEVYYREDTK